MCFVCEEIELVREVLGAMKRGEADASHLALAFLVACPEATHVYPSHMRNAEDTEPSWYGITSGVTRLMFVDYDWISIMQRISPSYRSSYIVEFDDLGQHCVEIDPDNGAGDQLPLGSVHVPTHEKPCARQLLLDTIRRKGSLVDEVAEVLPAQLLPELVAAYARPDGLELAEEATHSRQAKRSRKHA